MLINIFAVILYEYMILILYSHESRNKLNIKEIHKEKELEQNVPRDFCAVSGGGLRGHLSFRSELYVLSEELLPVNAYSSAETMRGR